MKTDGSASPFFLLGPVAPAGAAPPPSSSFSSSSLVHFGCSVPTPGSTRVARLAEYSLVDQRAMDRRNGSGCAWSAESLPISP